MTVPAKTRQRDWSPLRTGLSVAVVTISAGLFILALVTGGKATLIPAFVINVVAAFIVGANVGVRHITKWNRRGGRS